MHAISSYRGNRPTHTHPHPGLITIHCTTASVQCNNSRESSDSYYCYNGKLSLPCSDAVGWATEMGLAYLCGKWYLGHLELVYSVYNR